MKRKLLLILAIFLILPIGTKAENFDEKKEGLDAKTYIEMLSEDKNFDMEKTLISYDPIPKSIVIPAGKDNYINPITKEYFIVDNGEYRLQGVAKSLSFDIRYSVESENFYVSSSDLTVKSECSYYDNEGRYSSPSFGSTYAIRLDQSFFKHEDVLFPINATQTSTFGSGWKTNKPLTIRIYNDGSFDKYDGYIKGSGQVYD